MTNKSLLILFLLSSLSFPSFSADINKHLPIGLTEEEKPLLEEYLQRSRRSVSEAPVGPIHSLGEWEEAEAAMTLWNNQSLVQALSENGHVKILADSPSHVQTWKSRLQSWNVDLSKVSFFVVPTNSIWVRDYGPWWIVDGKGQVGIVDTIYNRPRPRDDIVPEFIGKELNIPVYKPGIVHTGGNYYSDGLGNAFSSTLVERENRNLSLSEILNRMLNFLGIESYTRSELGKDVTIEHLDTFGKLVAPDTWVFSRFPKNSRFYHDSERMVEILKNQLSPYGTPYKIFRLDMTSGGREYYRAYINSFISNGTLYFPAYGDEKDREVQAIYQEALPGYKIIGVDAKGTEWGDSVHCRTRNLIKRDTTFIFPQVERNRDGEVKISAKIFPRPGHKVISAQAIFLENGKEVSNIPLTLEKENIYSIPNKLKLASGEFYIQTQDSSGAIKTHPLMAPEMTIRF
jgi:agmatine deiminase